MTDYRILRAAGDRLDDIYVYTRDTWGEAQAKTYINGLFACFDDIASGRVQARAIPSTYDVTGYFTRYEKHYVYWRILDGGMIGIASILHERMNIGDRLAEDFG